jgi:hypothetical protein
MKRIVYLSLFASLCLLWGCGKPSESKVVAAVRRYYGATSLEVRVLEIREPQRACSGGPPCGPYHYPVVVHVSGICYAHFGFGLKDGERHRFDVEEKIDLLKNDDGSFQVTEIDGLDALAGGRANSLRCD